MEMLVVQKRKNTKRQIGSAIIEKNRELASFLLKRRTYAVLQHCILRDECAYNCTTGLLLQKPGPRTYDSLDYCVSKATSDLWDFSDLKACTLLLMKYLGSKASTL